MYIIIFRQILQTNGHMKTSETHLIKQLLSMEAFRKRVKAPKNYSECPNLLTISQVKGGKHNQNSV